MTQMRLNSEPVHLTPAPPRSSVMKIVDDEPVVEARVDRNCAVFGRPTPTGIASWLTVVPLMPIETRRPVMWPCSAQRRVRGHVREHDVVVRRTYQRVGRCRDLDDVGAEGDDRRPEQDLANSFGARGLRCESTALKGTRVEPSPLDSDA